MNRDEITREDFPPGKDGYDRLSVDAHLAAVAAWTAALEAQINALRVERDALRRQAQDVPPAEQAQPVEQAPSVDAEPSGPEQLNESEDRTDPEPSAEPDDRSEDEVSARLVATRLALEGAERDQIMEKLDAAYELDDTGSLVDDVLERLR